MPEVATAPVKASVNGETNLRHKTMVRKIGAVPMPDEDVRTSEQVDTELTHHLNAGWIITYTHLIELTPQGVFRMIFTLTR